MLEAAGNGALVGGCVVAIELGKAVVGAEVSTTVVGED